MLGLDVRAVVSRYIGGHSYLLVHEALPLAGVPVGQVERVAGELDTTRALALGEVRVVAACGCKRSNQLICSSIQLRICSHHVSQSTRFMPEAKHLPPPSHLFTNISKHKFLLPHGVFSVVGNVRLICQTRSELRFS